MYSAICLHAVHHVPALLRGHDSILLALISMHLEVRCTQFLYKVIMDMTIFHVGVNVSLYFLDIGVDQCIVYCPK